MIPQGNTGQSPDTRRTDGKNNCPDSALESSDTGQQRISLKSLARQVLSSKQTPTVRLSGHIGAGQPDSRLSSRIENRTPAGQSPDSDELSESMCRLEQAGVCVAIWDTGEMRVVVSESDTVQAIDAGGTIYNPEDMYMYVTLSEHERRLLHSFKKKFGGTTEWKAIE